MTTWKPSTKAFRVEGCYQTELSCFFAYVADQYVLLDSGSALGFGVGPMLISKFRIFNFSS